MSVVPDLSRFPDSRERDVVGNKLHFYVHRPAVSGELSAAGDGNSHEKYKIFDRSIRLMELTDDERKVVHDLKKNISFVAMARTNVLFDWLQRFGSKFLQNHGLVKYQGGAYHTHLMDGSKCYTMYWFEDSERGLIAPFCWGPHEKDPSQLGDKARSKCMKSSAECLEAASRMFAALKMRRGKEYEERFGAMGHEPVHEALSRRARELAAKASSERGSAAAGGSGGGSSS